ncbi:5261_t:CDS:2 [Paraglomus occultum]|uniref:5261_t:CDS:1 n=1 Tax=Paraglomus occultum TaxID=144539 RepID=A0A9N8VHB9_9GLOM|nr:5261_t:CDS:2 [Paraglomus occultum]
MEPFRSKLYISRSLFASSKSRHDNIIFGHPFNHHVDLFLPTVVSSENVNLWNTGEIFYYKVNLPLSYFIDESFINNYVNKGQVIALSLTEGIDISDVFSIDGNGILTLNVTKDTYESLGLAGKAARFGSRNQRFVIELQLSAKAMSPGKKFYERIKWCFEHTLVDSFPFVIMYINATTNKPSEMKFPSVFQFQKFTVQPSLQSTSHILIPDISLIKNPTNDYWKYRAIEVYDWIGMASLQADRINSDDNVDSYVSLYKPPDPYYSGNGDLVKSMDIPWAALTVCGFADSPISWIKQEHGFLMSGENNYTFIVWNDGTYVLYEAVGSCDGYS